MNSFPFPIHNTQHVQLPTNNNPPIERSANIILCGRGKGLDNLPGNKRFRQILRKYAASYKDPGNNRKDKSFLLRYIRGRMIDDENMQFFKRDKTGALKPLSGMEIKHKISHALRDINRSQNIGMSTLSPSYSKKSKDMVLENPAPEIKSNVEREDVNEVLNHLNEPLPFDLSSMIREDEQWKAHDVNYCHVMDNVLERDSDNSLAVKGWESEPQINYSNVDPIWSEMGSLKREQFFNRCNQKARFDPLINAMDDTWSDLNSRSAPF